MLKRAGYDPEAMVSFFELLNRQRAREPGKLEQFFSSHPAPADRAARLQAEADRLGPVARPRELGGFAGAQQALRERPAAPSRNARLKDSREPRRARAACAPAARRSSRRHRELRSFRQRDGFFTIEYPDNWRAYAPARGYGVVIAPEGGIRGSGTQSEGIVCGVVINHYDPFDRSGNPTLEEATDDIVAQVRRGNTHLRQQGRSRRQTVGGMRGLAVDLRGRSPATGEQERVSVLTRELRDGHLLYALVVMPGPDASRLGPAFDRMLDSMRVDERSAHR